VSGFVMVLSAEKLFAAPGGASQFLRRRIARIVPLYWLATAIFALAALRGAAAGKQLAPSVGEILASFAFLPWPRGLDGAPRPVHSLGWTLEYEMFFYCVFACFVWLPRFRAVAGIAAFLGALAIANAVLAPQNVAFAFWSDPIVLEFALGMGLALVYRAGLRLPGAASLALLAAALPVLVYDPMNSALEALDAVDPNGFLRLFSWGAPMAAIFAAVVLRPSAGDAGPAMRLAALVGDASYALYLFHPLTVIALRKSWLAGGLDKYGYWPLVVLSTLASILLALAIYRWVEKPLTALAQNWLVRRHAAKPAAVART
ncbi:MAG: acyltransferase family protein, partial [Rhodoblastus sp.]